MPRDNAWLPNADVDAAYYDERVAQQEYDCRPRVGTVGTSADYAQWGLVFSPPAQTGDTEARLLAKAWRLGFIGDTGLGCIRPANSWGTVPYDTGEGVLPGPLQGDMAQS